MPTTCRTPNENHSRSAKSCRRGLTLFELLVVLGILLVLGTLVVPAVNGHLGRSREDITWQSMRRVRDVIMGTYFDDMGQQVPRPGTPGIAAGRVNHPQLGYLFVNPAYYEDENALTEPYDASYDPVARLGWRGPYLLHEGEGFSYRVELARGFSELYGLDGDPAVLDGWGNPIVLQEPDANNDGAIDLDEQRHVRLVSAGPDGILNTDPNALLPVGTGDRGDDLVLFLRIAE